MVGNAYKIGDTVRIVEPLNRLFAKYGDIATVVAVRKGRQESLILTSPHWPKNLGAPGWPFEPMQVHSMEYVKQNPLPDIPGRYILGVVADLFDTRFVDRRLVETFYGKEYRTEQEAVDAVNLLDRDPGTTGFLVMKVVSEYEIVTRHDINKVKGNE